MLSSGAVPRKRAGQRLLLRRRCDSAPGERAGHRRRRRSLSDRSARSNAAKVIGRFPGETSCLTLVWAALDLYISHATNGIKFTQLERRHLKRIRYGDPEQTIHEEATAA
jgi:hypothetical protein